MSVGTRIVVSVAAFLLAFAGQARADELVTYKALGLESAVKAAEAAVAACRKAGFQVAVSVVDRGGNQQVSLRDRYAGPHTPDTAYRKAWTAVSFRTDTEELVRLNAAGALPPGFVQITNAMLIGGGVKIEAAGAIIGGIGVSGAPGGSVDEVCAKAGVEAIGDVLNFQ